MIADDAVIARVDLVDMEHIGEEAHKLVRLLGEALRPRGHVRLALEEFGVMSLEHAAAGAARNDDIVAVLECVDRLFREVFRRLPIAGIIRRLAAASLARNDDPATGVSKQLHRGEANRRAHDVDEAGDEEADLAAFLPAALLRGGRFAHGGHLHQNASLGPALVVVRAAPLRSHNGHEYRNSHKPPMVA